MHSAGMGNSLTKRVHHAATFGPFYSSASQLVTGLEKLGFNKNRYFRFLGLLGFLRF